MEDFGYDIVPQRDVVVCYSSFCYIYCRFVKIVMLLQTGWAESVVWGTLSADIIDVCLS